jgi:hypothetical protein
VVEAEAEADRLKEELVKVVPHKAHWHQLPRDKLLIHWKQPHKIRELSHLLQLLTSILIFSIECVRALASNQSNSLSSLSTNILCQSN